MTWEIAAVVLGILASGVACFGLWLRQKPAAQLVHLTSLESRVQRLEGAVAGGAVAARPMAMGQGLYGVRK